MEDLALHPAALDLLEVATTATGPTDPTYHIFKEWCAMSAGERSEALLSIDINGIMYFNTDLDLQLSLSSTPRPTVSSEKNGVSVSSVLAEVGEKNPSDSIAPQCVATLSSP